MSEAQDLMIKVMGAHRIESGMRIGNGERVEWLECLECGWKSEEFDLGTYSKIDQLERAHLAEEIDRALGGLTRETRTNPMSSSGMTTNYNTGEVISFSDIRRDARWVSGWSES